MAGWAGDQEGVATSRWTKSFYSEVGTVGFPSDPSLDKLVSREKRILGDDEVLQEWPAAMEGNLKQGFGRRTRRGRKHDAACTLNNLQDFLKDAVDAPCVTQTSQWCTGLILSMTQGVMGSDGSGSAV